MQTSKLKVYFKKYEFLLTGIIVIVFVIFLTFKLLIPNIIKAREIHENKELLKQKLLILEKKDNLLLAMDEKTLLENFAKLNYVIPESKDYSLLFTTLDSLQEKLGISITRTDFELGSVSTKSALLKKPLNNSNFSIPVTFEVIGTFDQIQGFLTGLSDLSGRLITADQIKISFENPAILKAAIAGKTYYNPLPKSIGSVDSALPEFSQNLEELFKRIKNNEYPLENTGDSNLEVPLGKENLFL